MDDQILSELMSLAGYYSAREAKPDNRLYADLDINGSDFIEFVQDIERRYDVDLGWVSPRDLSASAYDPTIKEISENVRAQGASSGEPQPNRS
jgi:hypothetical protein